MNKKQKKQLSLLCACFLLLLFVFVSLKLYQENKPEETQEEERYQVIQTDTSQVTEIEIISDTETVTLIKEDDGWHCVQDENSELDNTKIEAFLETAGSITSDTMIESVEDMSEYGLDSPALLVTLQWEDNLYTIKAGDYNSIVGCYYINKNDETTVYTADSSLYNALNKSLEDFEAAEAAETAETE